jgi:uncharacterized phage protein (TIGR02220 family)
VRYFTVKNYEKFQHYKDRSPPWIKLYNDVLDNYEFSRLQDASKLHLVLIWLLASRHDNRLPWDPEWIAKRIGASDKVNLDVLEASGFIEKVVNGSEVLAECKQIACLETEGETEKRESKSLSGLPPDGVPLEGKKPNGVTGQALEVLQFLNEKTGRKFRGLDGNGRPTANLDFIVKRLKTGVSVQDCKTVIARKFRDWGNDDKMQTFLRPETLFAARKFESYLGECTTEVRRPNG